MDFPLLLYKIILAEYQNNPPPDVVLYDITTPSDCFCSSTISSQQLMADSQHDTHISHLVRKLLLEKEHIESVLLGKGRILVGGFVFTSSIKQNYRDENGLNFTTICTW